MDKKKTAIKKKKQKKGRKLSMYILKRSGKKYSIYCICNLGHMKIYFVEIDKKKQKIKK